MESLLSYLKIYTYPSLEERIDLIIALFFFIFERFYPIRKQDIFRKEFFSQDFLHKIWDHNFYFFLYKFLEFFRTLLIYYYLDKYIIQRYQVPQLHLDISLAWFLIIFFWRDFSVFLIHYLFHRVLILWRFHMYHHSPKNLDFFSASRSDKIQGIFFELAISSIYIFIPQTPKQLFILFIMDSIFHHLIHSNVKYPTKFLGKLFITNHTHWWHHAEVSKYKYGQNFGGYTTVWDRLFGTYYFEEDYPERLGLSEKLKYPDNFFERMMYPYKRFFRKKL